MKTVKGNKNGKKYKKDEEISSNKKLKKNNTRNKK